MAISMHGGRDASLGLVVLGCPEEGLGHLTFHFPWFLQHLGCPTFLSSIEFPRFDQVMGLRVWVYAFRFVVLGLMGEVSYAVWCGGYGFRVDGFMVFWI